MSLSIRHWAGLIMLGMQVSQVSAISQITPVGAKFFNSTGHQFYIKGTASLSPSLAGLFFFFPLWDSLWLTEFYPTRRRVSTHRQWPSRGHWSMQIGRCFDAGTRCQHHPSLPCRSHCEPRRLYVCFLGCRNLLVCGFGNFQWFYWSSTFVDRRMKAGIDWKLI